MPATIVQAEPDLFNEWSSGLSLANTQSSFFEEIPTDLEHPETFTVAPEQLPENPTEVVQPQPPVSAVTEPPESGPQTRKGKHGGNITLEKTSRGWRATLDPEVGNLAVENFYGQNKDELIFTICESKIEANKTVHRLKKDKLVGGEETVHPAAPPPPPAVIPKVNVLSADDIYAVKNKLAGDDPTQAFDEWVKKRFGLDPEQFAEALKSAPEAKKILQANETKDAVEEVNKDFVERNSDYLKYVSTEDDEINKTNIRLLVGRMSKAFLNKKVSKSSPQVTVDNTIYELYTRGFWTVDNLETAKEELVENGLFEQPATVRTSQTQPQPVATQTQSGPSVPAAPRIAATTGQPVGAVNFGIPASSSTPVVVPEAQSLTDVDLYKLPLDQLRAIAAAQLKAQR